MNFITKIMKQANLDKLNQEQLSLVNVYSKEKSDAGKKIMNLTSMQIILSIIAMSIKNNLVSIFLFFIVSAILFYVFFINIKMYKSRKLLIKNIIKISERGCKFDN